jgi:tetratricopeptide (TPR) repeat protein
MKSTVFLSYSSAQNDHAKRIELALKEEGHSVFRDRSSLPPGESFDAQIRTAIEESDLFIFLISPESLLEGHYALTELKFAEEKWSHPGGHVLPVLVEPTQKESIPAFLRAVTILQPVGDIPAEVVAAVDRLTAPWWRWFHRPQGLAALILLALLLIAGVWKGFSDFRDSAERNREVAHLLREGQLQHDSGDYPDAWDRYAKAHATDPGNATVVDAQERLAMDWLDNIRTGPGSQSFRDIVDKVWPVLSNGAIGNEARRSADLLAHMGWGDFLRSRDGIGGLDPVQYYTRSLTFESDNVFAHTMWGFHLLQKGESLAQAKEHFAKALASKRQREYVRGMQIAALMWRHDPELENEVIKVANEMRSNHETMPGDGSVWPGRWRVWNIYYDRLVNGSNKPQFLSALSPADHLATFRWLYPEDEFPKDKYLYLFILAQLQEVNDSRTEALDTYRLLMSTLEARGTKSGRMVGEASASIARLSK